MIRRGKVVAGGSDVGYFRVMGTMLGYMVTWTTYGTWLQGDARGYVKDGEVLSENQALEEANRRNMRGSEVRLSKSQKRIVREAIEAEGRRFGHKIYALAVCTNHVHILLDSGGMAVKDAVSRYKNAAFRALREAGHAERVWTRGYDKRYCFDEESLRSRREYVERHNDEEFL